MALSVSVAAITLVSVKEEIDIGRQANAQVRKNVPEFTDAAVQRYVRGIASRLVAVAPGPRYPYTFSIANYREINAFALPGGPIWIHRGVLHAATNESQLAGVLAHEIAHIGQRHAADQLTKATVANLGLGLLGAMLGNSGGAGAAQMAAGVFTNGVFLKFSRDHERDADRVGLQMLRRAGWNGRGMIELFQIIEREGKRNPSAVEAFFSSHPSPRDRIASLQARIPRSSAGAGSGGRRDSAEFQAIRTRSLKMRPPRSMP